MDWKGCESKISWPALTWYADVCRKYCRDNDSVDDVHFIAKWFFLNFFFMTEENIVRNLFGTLPGAELADSVTYADEL